MIALELLVGVLFMVAVLWVLAEVSRLAPPPRRPDPEWDEFCAAHEALNGEWGQP